MEIDPKDKALIDAVVETAEREKSRRAWRIWLVVAAASLGSIWVAKYDSLPGLARIALFVTGVLGILLFLGFLSTKPFGRRDSAGPDWWWFP